MSVNDYRGEVGESSNGIGTLRSQILAILKITHDQVVSEELTRLCVEAHESTIYEVEVDVVDKGGSGRIHAILKRYDDSVSADRVSDDARVLEMLYEAGVKVPQVLGRSPEQKLILMEYAGDTTLADLLKGHTAPAEQAWNVLIEALAKLHKTLEDVWADDGDLPGWIFTPEQRRDWAAQGLKSWSEWLGPEHGIRTFKDTGLALSGMAERLSQPDKNNRIIWGDCNPKNIIVSGSDVRFVDFQLKRSSIMLDLVLLLAFADCPETYLPKATAYPLLKQYWLLLECRFSELGSLADFLTWYDEELLWRILVYGGMLLEKKEARLPCWSDVCERMLPDLLELLQDRTGV